jgi:DNA replication protein DnaC
MNINEIKRLTHEMRLFGLYESIERRLNSFKAEAQTGEEFLRILLEDERQYRKNASAKKLEKKAQFRRDAVIENWDSSIERGMSKTKLRELASLSFWDSKKNLIIVGATGCGKTQLAMALGRAACHHQLKVSFFSTNLLFEEMRAQRSSGKFLSWSKNIRKSDIIIFDDFGLRSFTHDEAMFFVDLFEERYQNKIHIFTSQVNLEGWKNLYEDPVTGQAIVDRIKNPSEEVRLIGNSYRERIGKGGETK